MLRFISTLPKIGAQTRRLLLPPFFESSITKAGTFRRLSLVELILLLVAQNQQIQIRKAEWDLSSAYK
jgi:hypothetical protein